MNKLFASVAAAIAYPLAVYFARHVSDAWTIRQLERVKAFIARRNPRHHLVTVIGDAIKIFADPKASAMARRLITEARPAQFKALVRGAVRG